LANQTGDYLNNQASLPSGGAGVYKVGLAGRDANGASVPGEFLTGTGPRTGLAQPSHNAQAQVV